jgi:hypothetical protein
VINTLDKKEFVKLTTKGKVSLTLQGTMRGVFLACVEQMLQWTETSTKGALDMKNVEERIRFALVSEIYTRHFASFSLLRTEKMKLLLTLPQALAFWQLSQEYDFQTLHDPSMGALLMQLHQKLS